MTKRRWLGAAVAALALGGLTVTGVRSQEAPMQPDMEAWQKAMTPGDHHEWLMQLEGDWSMVTRMWMQGPAGPPSESQGNATFEPILGGRYIREVNSGEVMGRTMEAESFYGYDNFKGKYVAIWLNSMGTAPLVAEGLRPPGTDTVTFFGEMDEPMLDIHDMTVKYVWSIKDQKTMVFEIHDFNYPEGQTKVVEVEYTRK